MKKEYLEPIVEVFYFTEDVVKTSPVSDGDNEFGKAVFLF